MPNLTTINLELGWLRTIFQISAVNHCKKFIDIAQNVLNKHVPIKENYSRKN